MGHTCVSSDVSMLSVSVHFTHRAGAPRQEFLYWQVSIKTVVWHKTVTGDKNTRYKNIKAIKRTHQVQLHNKIADRSARLTWRLLNVSRRTCLSGRTTTCAALAWRCTPNACLRRSSAWRFPRPPSKYQIYATADLFKKVKRTNKTSAAP